jgi:hypothetical protein
LSPPRLFLGLYVTNFEVSYFVECDTSSGDCDNWLQRERRNLSGSSEAQESHLTNCVERWNGSVGRWALFAISFRGRETLDLQQRRLMYDTERRVLLDEILAMDLIGTDRTVAWALPRYRARPSVGC